MESRKVQRTADMHYLYLPTKWCKEHKISGQSKIGIQTNVDGSLALYPQVKKQKPIKLKLRCQSKNNDTLHKLIIACYTSPAEAFSITLEQEKDFTALLTQKDLLSLALVEIEGNSITCESSLPANDPSSLLITMLRKLKNLVLVLSKKAPRALLERYEEEIDRTEILINKAVTSALTHPAKAKRKTIEVHYISLIAKELESIADHLLLLCTIPDKQIKKINTILTDLKTFFEEDNKKLNVTTIQPFLDKVAQLQQVKVKDIDTYSLKRIVRSLNSISEVLVDWAVLKETQ